MYTKYWNGTLVERDHLEDLVWGIMLEWIFRKQDWKLWAVLIWLR